MVNLQRPVSGPENGSPTASLRLAPGFNTGFFVKPGRLGFTIFALCSELPSTSTQSPHHLMECPAWFDTENIAKRPLLFGAFVYPTNVIPMALMVAGG